jgi:chromosome segregation ATPase
MAENEKPDEHAWVVILEDIRSQNRATMEALEVVHVSLSQRIDRLDRDSRERDATLEFAVRGLRGDVQVLQSDVRELKTDVAELKTDVAELKVDVRELKGQVGALQVQTGELQEQGRTLTEKVDGLGRLEGRVAALEQRPA